MKIEFQDSFLKKLNRQIAYIAADKPDAARRFKKDILTKCMSLVDNPFKCRQSIYFERDDIRDMIFKGYVIVYRVSLKSNKITVFALVKNQNSLT